MFFNVSSQHVQMKMYEEMNGGYDEDHRSVPLLVPTGGWRFELNMRSPVTNGY